MRPECLPRDAGMVVGPNVYSGCIYKVIKYGGTGNIIMAGEA